ncbi:hypothetical protein [Desulfosarcina alkanivorans]|uniref:hypothetical protein n=1 Tax=Desulfosarcina alkanivorans TaxID=571177 RepID=UPI0012D357D6|nr:hypothetical protein [Desulfosarcina alkanivorans]
MHIPESHSTKEEAKEDNYIQVEKEGYISHIKKIDGDRINGGDHVFIICKSLEDVDAFQKKYGSHQR